MAGHTCHTMRAPKISWIVVGICVLFLLAQGFGHKLLLADSDTRGILHGLREHPGPWVWFTRDWPLENHFYRPVSTLSFALDQLLFGTNDAGWGFTNALLCAACVVLLAWVVHASGGSDGVASMAAIFFTAWHFDLGSRFAGFLVWLLPIALVFIAAQNRCWRRGPWAGLIGLYLASEMIGMVGLQSRMLDWIPGRTASVMTVFALASLGLGFMAAKGSRSALAACLLCLALALGSYEQAVMVPALIVGAVVLTKLESRRVSLTSAWASWFVLAAYAVVRHFAIPSGPSRYQQQQFRSGGFSSADFAQYALPFEHPLRALFGQLSTGWEMLLTADPYTSLALAVGFFAAAFVVLRSRDWPRVAFWFAASALAYLPMAWVKMFEHYHYLPMALRAVFVAELCRVIFRWSSGRESEYAVRYGATR